MPMPDGSGTDLHRAIRDKNLPLIFSLSKQNKGNATYFQQKDSLQNTVLFMGALELMSPEVVQELITDGASFATETPQKKAEIIAALNRAPNKRAAAAIMRALGA